MKYSAHSSAKTWLLWTLLLVVTTPVFSQHIANQSHFFIEQKGQILDDCGSVNTDVLFLLPVQNGLNVQLRRTGFSYDTYQIDTTQDQLKLHRIDIEFNNPMPDLQVVSQNQETEKLHFPVMGIYDIPTFRKIIYRNVFPHIDIEFIAGASANKPFEYNFLIHPGGDINDIQLIYKGMEAVEVSEGNMRLSTSLGHLTENIPNSYLLNTREKLEIDWQHQVKKNGSALVGFSGDIPLVDETVVIDPVPRLVWGTYYGGAEGDSFRAITFDGTYIYATGNTNSLTNIATNGTYQSALADAYDVVIVKMNERGERQWSSYYGAAGNEIGHDIEVDQNGDVFIAGATQSISGMATSNASQVENGGGLYDAFIAKFSAAGQLIWGSYFGGAGFDYGNTLTLDGQGNAYLGGWSDSEQNISTTGAFQPNYAGIYDATLSKYDQNGNLVWSTYFGGEGEENGIRLATAGNGNILLAGATSSETTIATPGADQFEYGGGEKDMFISEFSPNGDLVWSTYLGGTDREYGYALTVDDEGNIYIGGSVYSPDGLATAGTHESLLHGESDGFVAKFSPIGQKIWGTYVGGTNQEVTYDISVDQQNNLIMLGVTQSTDRVATADAYQLNYSGGLDIFLAKFDRNGRRLWGTYYGGPRDDIGYGIIAGGNRQYYLTGQSTNATGLTTPDAHQPAFGGNYADGIIARFSDCEQPTLNVPNGGYLCFNSDVVLEFQFTGIAPFTVAYSIDGIPQTPLEFDDPVAFPTFSSEDYQDSINITQVVSDGCVGEITGLPFVKKIERLSAGVPRVDCDQDAGTYVVSFELFGGEGVYIAEEEEGFINGSQFTSRPVPLDQDWAFLISTGFGCDGISVSGRAVCAPPCEPLEPNLQSNSPLCAGENLTLSSAVFSTNEWIGPNGFSSSNSTINIPNVSGDDAGTYQLIIVDEQGCQDTVVAEVLIGNPPEIKDVELIPSGCIPGLGAINVMADGEALPLQYSIDGGNTFQLSPDFTMVAAGNYEIVIEDQLGCQTNTSVELLPGTSGPLIDGVTFGQDACEPGDKEVTIQASGGNGMLRFALNGDSFQEQSTFIAPPGTYLAIVLDESNCGDSLLVEIPQGSNIAIDQVQVVPADCGGLGGEINISVIGGTNPITFSLNDTLEQSNSALFSNLAQGSYLLKVSDANGCRDSTLVKVEGETCAFQVPNAFSPNGDGINDFLQVHSMVEGVMTMTAYRIFDRWGNLLYEANDFPMNGSDLWWDGKVNDQLMPVGTYLFQLEVKLANGKHIVESGDFLLVY